jgi:hypothetical protein
MKQIIPKPKYNRYRVEHSLDCEDMTQIIAEHLRMEPDMTQIIAEHLRMEPKEKYFKVTGKKLITEGEWRGEYEDVFEPILEKKPSKQQCIEWIRSELHLYGASRYDTGMDGSHDEPCYELANLLMVLYNI